jgi:hypothetical protein
LALRKRLKASRTSVEVHGFGVFAAARDGPDLVVAFAAALPRFGIAAARGLEFPARLATPDFDLGRGLRVIFDIFRVY